MLFNSLSFLLLHIIALCLYWSTNNQKVRQLILLSSSFIFYGWLYWPALILLSLAIIVNFGFSLWIQKRNNPWALRTAIIVNLMNLGWFKYSTFAIENLQLLIDQIGGNIQIPTPNYWLPLGISFYTFQIIGYFIDIQRREIDATKSLLSFAVFKCYYAQLIAGPIVRANSLLPQLETKQHFSVNDLKKGFFLMLAGLAIKIGVADIIAQFVDYNYDHIEELTNLEAWLSAYGFSFQILSDFWGYSTIAVGIGLMFGIALPMNFNLPYIAQSCQDFWRRWHITLSIWFRDYLYIPLGGNRDKRRIYFNLITTMTIAGIWHGAGWNFLIWGFGHGVWLAIERAINWTKYYKEKASWWGRILRQLWVFHVVTILWVFFRAKTFNEATGMIGQMFSSDLNFNTSHKEALIITMILFILLKKPIARLLEGNRFIELKLHKQVLICFALFLMVIAYADAQLDFIYFIF